MVSEQYALRKSRSTPVVQAHADGGIPGALIRVEVRQPIRYLTRNAGVGIEGPVYRAQLGRIAKSQSHVASAAGDAERVIRKLARGAELIRGERVIQPVGESAVESGSPMI